MTLDPFFRVNLISATPVAGRTIYAALHQDYSEDYVFDSRDRWPQDDRIICLAHDN